MDRGQRRLLAECFIASVGLAPGQYEMVEMDNSNYWQFNIPLDLDTATPLSRGRLRQFASILGRKDGQITIYATGDWRDSDHQNRFQPQQSDESDGWIRFSLPEDGLLWNYAARSVSEYWLAEHVGRAKGGGQW